MHYEYTIAWDGEPSMSGAPHRKSTGTFYSLKQAKDALHRVPGFKVRKPNIRVEVREVTDWEVAYDPAV